MTEKNNQNNAAASNKMPTTAHELRDYLADAMCQLGTGTMTAATANGMANLAGKILSITKQELEYHKLKGTKTEDIYIDFIHPREKELPKLTTSLK